MTARRACLGASDLPVTAPGSLFHDGPWACPSTTSWTNRGNLCPDARWWQAASRVVLLVTHDQEI